MSSESVHETKEKKESSCYVDRDGVTLWGYQLSWLVVLLIAIVIYIIFNQESVNKMLKSFGFGGETDVTVPRVAPQTVSSSAFNQLPVPPYRMEASNVPIYEPRMPTGEIARMMGFRN